MTAGAGTESSAGPRDPVGACDRAFETVSPESDRPPAGVGTVRGVRDPASGVDDDELPPSADPVAPPEPVRSAMATAGIATTAAPMPNATANAPTRPTWRS